MHGHLIVKFADELLNRYTVITQFEKTRRWRAVASSLYSQKIIAFQNF